MIAAQISGEKTMQEEKSESRLREALWLAKKDIRRAWLSYPVSALFVLLISLVVIPGVNNSILNVRGFGESGARFEVLFNAGYTDYMFLILGCVLAVNSLSADYLRVFSTDVFTQRLTFLRSLPFSTRSLVMSRALSMLAALPLTVPALFVPAYLYSDLRELGFSYIWFVGIWLGWSLFYAGFTLFCEFTMNWRFYTRLSFAFVFALLAGVVLLEVFANMQLVARTASLAQSYGPLPALISLIIGTTTFALFARATKNRLERRDLSA